MARGWDFHEGSHRATGVLKLELVLRVFRVRLQSEDMILIATFEDPLDRT
jgi:hypothetical protein